ncbi:MAG TPA: trypsin-like serine protease [Clostridia bacterium]|nr:trypsin-like serine protease [Clostridia bacterium]
MLKLLRKKSVILLVIGTVLLSGIAGFIGSYLANSMVADGSKANGLLQVASASGQAMSIEDIARIASKSVVEITTETVKTDIRMRQYISEGAGSGVIISSDGYIVTNNHVIKGASKITVTTNDGRNYQAQLVGKDTKTDLAVIKIQASGLQPAVFGNSDQLVVGELAVAIGNPLGQLGGTVTEGIISALNRDIIIDGETMNLLQTSAAINPGNSGGGLFNKRAELIGIVNAKSSGVGIEGIGFAIPVNTVKDVVNQIMNYGYVRGRVEVGVTLVDISDIRTALLYHLPGTGVYVLEVRDRSSGFEVGDRIIKADGKEIRSSTDFKQVLSKHKVGDVLQVVVQRGNRIVGLKVTLKEASS